MHLVISCLHCFILIWLITRTFLLWIIYKTNWLVSFYYIMSMLFVVLSKCLFGFFYLKPIIQFCFEINISIKKSFKSVFFLFTCYYLNFCFFFILVTSTKNTTNWYYNYYIFIFMNFLIDLWFIIVFWHRQLKIEND